VLQGQYAVSDDPEVMLTTVLGSCVAACIRDPDAAVGGMNHFLLPDSEGSGAARALSYGVHAMELLVNALLRAGARRSALEAKLFGGGHLTDRLSPVGKTNADFAESYLRREGLAFRGGSLGGAYARKLQYWPVSGRARQRLLSRSFEDLLEIERSAPQPPTHAGSVELF
jgi:chemotaxis protein CheD